MHPLQPPDTNHLEAAKGWCELGAFLDANEELEKISSPLSVHPDVLEVRWEINSNLERWDGALEIADAIIRLNPERVTGWLNKARSLQESKRPQEAYETLIEANKRFPKDRIVLYDLACVCCMMKRLKEVDYWLAKAVEVGGKEIKTKALSDPSFDQFWKRIEER